MTVAVHGVGVSRGIAIGRVHLLERDTLDIPEYQLPAAEVETEVQRLEHAVETARRQLREVRERIPASVPGDIAAFIDTHLLMLEDVALLRDPIRRIRAEQCNAELALTAQRDALVGAFEQMDDAYLRARSDDVIQVVNRVLRVLLKHTPLEHEQSDSEPALQGNIVLADDLAPADTVLLQHHGIAAFATEYGGPTSHTAILARSLGIPAIVGLHHARRWLKKGDTVVVDGRHGVLLIDPDARSLEFYRRRMEADRVWLNSLNSLKSAATRTRDGADIELQANIELPRDFATVTQVGAAGVGLYRTEFLYMNRDHPPEEEEHFQTYLGVLRALGGLPLTIRTLDLGADKQVDGGRQQGPLQSNPALGLRAIRLCLREPALFRPQLRAILRASAHGNVRMMIPMLSNPAEMEQVLALVAELRAELDEQGVAYSPTLPIGGMIEVPAAAVCADLFARRLDFLSIGTNDLIQYTIAIDRVNDEVNYLYDPLHPAVLRLVRTTLDAGAAAGIPVAMCGEMAGDPRYVRLLLALGLRSFSVHPSSVLEVKKIILDSDLRTLRALGTQALAAGSGEEIAALLERDGGTVN
jgi:phosphotransferase system enzyme I (PtsI)